jgi:hypothetical protein
MRGVSSKIKPFFAASLVAAVVASVPTYRASAAPVSDERVGAIAGAAEVTDPQARAQVFRMVDGELSCGDATLDEAQLLAAPRDDESLRVIYSGGANKGAGGLTIVLFGTEQLEANRQAKNAFIRAAQTWEGIIKSQITINVKVDFGPTRFGQEWDNNILGSTFSGESAKPYADVRAALIAGASSPEELALYNQLPQTAMLTDAGPVETIVAPSAAYRALGLLDAIPPDFEIFRPSIGFNDGFPYDFDPRDGITSGRTDFNAVVLHEIGHLLGFVSAVGDLELNSSGTPALSLWDLFRFRPGATLGEFGTLERVLGSGGDQVFFDGRPSLPLSTGRGDGSGGDGNQASHWKDDDQNGGRYIGIMDPTIPRSEEFKIVPADLRALDLFGYRFTNGDAPTLNTLTADLTGDVLSLTGTFTDANADVAQVKATFLDGRGGVVGESEPVDVDFGTSSSADFTVELPGLNDVPAAVQVSLALVDRAGNESEAVTADFSQADAGGAVLAKVAFKNDKLKIRGSGLAGEIELEINGVVLAVPITPTAGGTRIKLSGTAGDLSLRGGANRVRLRTGGLRSNIFVVNL